MKAPRSGCVSESHVMSSYSIRNLRLNLVSICTGTWHPVFPEHHLITCVQLAPRSDEDERMDANAKAEVMMYG